MKLKEAVNSIIKMSNLTQREVAEQIGSSQGALSTMLVRNNMQVKTLLSITDFLGYEIVLRPKNGTNKNERTVVVDQAGKDL